MTLGPAGRQVAPAAAADQRGDAQPALFVGLMSGTSLDGVDGVLVDLAPRAAFRVVAHRHAAYPPELRAQLLALNQPGLNELHTAALAANGVALAYAAVVKGLLEQAAIGPAQVCAIGAHGQTVRHRPGEFDGIGYTSQLLSSALLAELTDIDVVADFRTRDLAAGGQGAPLVPAFHHAAFAQPRQDIAVLNLGGMANITFLPAAGQVSGHDCGPGNVLLDLWCQLHTGASMDLGGAWGRRGKSLPQLLARMLADDFITRPPPKSTGRDHFNQAWLSAVLDACQHAQPPWAAQDIQHTLADFTAYAAANSLQRALPQAAQLLVCGGGAFNQFLMERLQAAMPTLTVRRIDEVCALDPVHVEAAAFAWLAQAHLNGQPGNLAAVTGARGLRVLGALYPA